MKYIIVKAYNNNVLGVIDLNGVKRILVGNGIGFGARPNHLFTKYDDVAASFVLEDSKNRKSFQQLADDVDAGLLLLVEQQLKIIQQTLGVRLNENIHITLLDHISFSIDRLEKGLAFNNPFDDDLSIIYEKEYALASKLVDRINAYCHIKLPQDEIGIVAIHIHSACQNETLEISRKKTTLIEETITSLCREFTVKFDRRSLSYQRLLIHTKLAFERILTGAKISCGMADYIMENYAAAYRRIRIIMQDIGQKNGLEIPQSEICYLVLHFMRIEEERQVTKDS